MAGNEDYINKLYDEQLSQQKEQLTTDYNQGVSALDEQKKKAQQQTDTALTRTAVEAQKNQRNYAEVQSAYGLTSGSMAQARLAQNNQMQQDMTDIRTAHQNVDAGIEQQRSLLGKEYAAAIRQAQASNNLERAQALYEEAARQEEILLAKQEESAKAMAAIGDYSLYAQLYGLTSAQQAKLEAQWRRENGYTTGGSSGSGGGATGGGRTYDTHGYTAEQIRQLQQAAGIPVDGIWGPQTEQAYNQGFRPNSDTGADKPAAPNPTPSTPSGGNAGNTYSSEGKTGKPGGLGKEGWMASLYN